MMQTLRRCRALRTRDRLLVAEAATVLVVVRLGISVFGCAALRRTLERGARGFARARPSATPHDVRAVAWSVAAVTRRLPFRATCLIESLAVDAMLRRRRVASEIRFGVRPPDGGTLSAHAWVEHDGAVVFGARPDLADYAVLVPRDAG